MDQSTPPDISIIVPALKEADNLKLLVPQVHAAIGQRRYELLVVDDNSPDATPQVCRELAEKYPLQLLVRPQPKDGLSGAVLEGMKIARGEILVVMDADLQHPPQKLPVLIDAIESGNADFAIGSRHVPGASSDEHWGIARRLNSWVATVLARPFAGSTHDPMSGFFALRRSSVLAARHLTPLGYKIGLELMCKTRAKRVVEVPIHFGLRTAGESKLTIVQQFKYLEHLSRLYDFTFPRASPILKFLIATFLAWFVGLAAFLSTLIWDNDLASAAIVAYGCGIGVIAVFFMRYVRTQREFIIRPRPWVDFVFTSITEWTVAGLSAWYAASRLNHPHPLEVFVLAFGAGTLARYILRKEFHQDIRGNTGR